MGCRSSAERTDLGAMIAFDRVLSPEVGIRGITVNRSPRCRNHHGTQGKGWADLVPGPVPGLVASAQAIKGVGRGSDAALAFLVSDGASHTP
ncbi:hypothetical protein AB0M41_40925 [Streptomyces sp. NPDC051896]|uniref:hypothetical protein n=1 Tax=Streptomyces sp. NPDC051896 TaxID=3155416 RepID=UPI0034411C33